MTEPRKEFTAEEAHRYGEAIGIDWISAPFDVAQFQAGMNVELEHGLRDPLTNVTDDDPHVTAKIALAHLNEFHDYYTRLARMEEEANGEPQGSPPALAVHVSRRTDYGVSAACGCQLQPAILGS